MSEESVQPRPRDPGQVEEQPTATHEDAPRTGNHVVDRVLGTLDLLPDSPIDEHVAVFEQALAQLRGALDGPRLPRP